jgi:hypothetical protein
MELRRKRKRGSVPTAQGLDKLENAIQIKEDRENNSKQFTLDSLSFQTGLDSQSIAFSYNLS